jgi:hypothetical protein
MSSEKPYAKWYGRDWLGDSALRMLDAADRGVWIDLLCVMMAGEPYGHLALNGKPMSDEQVARIIGMDVQAYKTHLAKLIEYGIPSETTDGMIYSRRLVKDHKKFTDGKKFGKKGGGNPSLIKEEEKEEPRTQNPEAKGGLKVPFIGETEKTYIGTTGGGVAEPIIHTHSIPVEPLDSRLVQLAQKVRGCRPEYGVLQVYGIAHTLNFYKDDPRLEWVVGEWCIDHANSLAPFNNPLASLRKNLQDNLTQKSTRVREFGT